MRKNYGCVVGQKFAIWKRRVVWVVILEIGEVYNGIVESLRVKEWPHVWTISEHGIEQMSASNVSWKVR